MPKGTLKAHVTYEDSKRILSFQKGDEVKSLRQLFLGVFSDKLSDETAPKHVTFQCFNDDFNDYVDLSMEGTLEKDIKLRAVTSKKQTSSTEASNLFSPWLLCLLNKHSIPWTDLVASQPTHHRYHPIIAGETYRFWSSVSREKDSLIQVDPTTNTVSCNGTFDLTQASFNTVVTAVDKGTKSQPNLVALTFSMKNKQYAMTAMGKGQSITVVEVPSNGQLGNESIFQPFAFWSYTMFRNEYYNTLYLGSDSAGNTTLVVMDNLDYPNPQALFIANMVHLDTMAYE